MNEFVLSDDEIIYYIKQNHEEAYELLFFRYERNMRGMLEKIENYLYMNLDDEMIRSLYMESFNKAIYLYDSSRGMFYYFLKELFRFSLIRFYRDTSSYYEKEVLSYDDKDSYIQEPLDDSNAYDVNNIDAKMILEMIKDYSELDYNIVKLWMIGYKYKEISDILKITEKQTYYRLDKVFKWVRSNLSLEK